MNETLASSTWQRDAVRVSIIRRRVPASTILTVLVATLGLQQLLLWCFLGASAWLIVPGGFLIAAFCLALRRVDGWPRDLSIDLRVIAACSAISAALFALGGQGGFFYANADWQARNAVLHDLVTYPWPFVYAVDGQLDVLRAPLGFYLLPALLGKAGGLRCAQLVMLVQSTVLLACILSLGASLFDSTRKRLIGLVVFLAFSGMDVLGTLLVRNPLNEHLEWWWFPLQFSSHVTQAFWVPMHALAGWIGALLYLLWRTRRIPLAAFLSPLPLLALLSPLALIGVIPFAADAGISALRSKSIRLPDLLLPVAGAMLSLPSLLYLSAGSAAVGSHFTSLSVRQWAVFEGLEVYPYLVAVLLGWRSNRLGLFVPFLTTAILFVLPWSQVGTGPDLNMRASIPALAVLAVMVADLLVSGRKDRGVRLGRAIVIPTLLIGAVTPATEIWHAISRPRPSVPSCSYFGVVPQGRPTYITQLQQLPRPIAPAHPAIARPSDPSSCRELLWYQVEKKFSGRH